MRKPGRRLTKEIELPRNYLEQKGGAAERSTGAGRGAKICVPGPCAWYTGLVISTWCEFYRGFEALDLTRPWIIEMDQTKSLLIRHLVAGWCRRSRTFASTWANRQLHGGLGPLSAEDSHASRCLVFPSRKTRSLGYAYLRNRSFQGTWS
jgi:hypothetical protein